MIVKIIKQFNQMLNGKQKVQIVVLMILILMGGILETASVSLVLPLMTAILDPVEFGANKYVEYFMGVFNVNDMRQFIRIIAYGIIATFIFKSIYLIGLAYVQARFINKNRMAISRKLLSQYLHKPYEYYLNSDTAVILRIVYSDMMNAFDVLHYIMKLVSEMVVGVCLGIYLLSVDFTMSFFIIGLLAITSFFLLYIIKPKLTRAGHGSRVELANLYKVILQSITGIKDVKVTNKENFFVDEYKKPAEKFAKYQVVMQVLQNLPMQLIESVSIIGILIYILFNMSNGVGLDSMIPLISAFGVAAIRLLPSINRINNHISNISYHKSAVDNIHEIIDMKMLVEQEIDGKGKNKCNTSLENSKLTLDSLIEINDVCYKYPNTDKYILDKVNMKIPVGKSVGIVGASGSGKSTMVDVILGLLKIESGEILSDGINIEDEYKSWLSDIGYIPQVIFMLDDSIRNNIAFGVNKDKIDDERIWSVLEEAQLADFIKGLPMGLDEEIGERGVRLSGGQRQRLGIARALYHDPKLLVFDEATSALDSETESALMEAIEALQGQKTMVIIAHRLKTIENCDIIYEVKDGKISQTR